MFPFKAHISLQQGNEHFRKNTGLFFFFLQGFWEGVSHSTPNKGEFPEEHSREVTKRGEFIHRGKIPVPSGKPLPLDAFEGS